MPTMSKSSLREAEPNWSAPFSPHQDGTPTEHGFVSLFAVDEHVGAVWLDGRKTQPQAQDHGNLGMTLRAGTLTANGPIDEREIDSLTCDCCQTDAIVMNGEPIVVYRDRDENNVRDISIVKMVNNTWSKPRRLHDDGWKIRGCPVNGPAIDGRDSTVAVAWFTNADDNGRVMLAVSYDGGENFPQTLEVAPSTFGRTDVAILPDQRIAVLWVGATDNQSAALKLKVYDKELKPLREKNPGADGAESFLRLSTNGGYRFTACFCLDQCRGTIDTQDRHHKVLMIPGILVTLVILGGLGTDHVYPLTALKD